MRYKDTDYLHASTRVTYLENQLITKEDLLKAIDADSAREAYRLLSGKQIFKERGMDEYELAFEENLAENYKLVEDITEDLGLTYIFRYPIDGHNMKVLIKNKMTDEDFSGLLKSGGTIDVEVMKRELDKNDFDAVPQALGQAGAEATDELAKTRDSQIVDLLIDKAIVALMGEKAREIDCESLTEYVISKIDLINLKAALRLLRMKKDSYSASKVFAEGGSFEVKEWDEAYILGFDGIKNLIEKTVLSERMGEIVNLIKQGKDIALFQQQEDGCFKDLFDRTRVVPFGIEPVITYLYMKDREIRACRLVLVSKIFNIAKEKIVERLGYIYAD